MPPVKKSHDRRRGMAWRSPSSSPAIGQPRQGQREPPCSRTRGALYCPSPTIVASCRAAVAQPVVPGPACTEPPGPQRSSNIIVGLLRTIVTACSKHRQHIYIDTLRFYHGVFREVGSTSIDARASSSRYQYKNHLATPSSTNTISTTTSTTTQHCDTRPVEDDPRD